MPTRCLPRRRAYFWFLCGSAWHQDLAGKPDNIKASLVFGEGWRQWAVTRRGRRSGPAASQEKIVSGRLKSDPYVTSCQVFFFFPVAFSMCLVGWRSLPEPVLVDFQEEVRRDRPPEPEPH